MKTRLIFILMIHIFCCVSGHVSQEEIFLRGTELYDQDSWQEALDEYQKMNQQGVAVLYNMGLCYYQLGQYENALVFLMRAKRESCDGHQLLMLNDLVDKVSGLISPASDHSSGWFNTAYHYGVVPCASVSLFMLQIIFLCLWYLLFVLLKKNKTKRKTVVGCMGLLISLFSVATMIKYKDRSDSIAVAVQSNNIFVGPDVGYDVLATLDCGRRVIVEQKHNGWYKIRCADDVGWVKQDTIQLV